MENDSKDIANSIGKLLTPEDIASLLSISPRTVYDYAQKGKIPAIKMLGQWRFKESDIVDWIESMKLESDQLSREYDSVVVLMAWKFGPFGFRTWL